MKASEIRIANPCGEDWTSMTPQVRGRFCAACQKTVHDLSEMSEPEAKALLSSATDICVTFLADSRGSVRFSPSPLVPVRQLARRASAAGLGFALAACTPHGDGPQLETQSRPSSSPFLQVQPTIPDEQPCTSPPPERPQESLFRLTGDIAAESPRHLRERTENERPVATPASTDDDEVHRIVGEMG